MNLVQRIASAVKGGIARKNDDGITSAALLGMLGGGGFARSGAMVSWLNALAVTAVLGCIRVVSEDIAKVDLKLFLQDGNSLNPAYDHPLYDLLGCAPNAWQTSFEFRELLTSFAMLTGNGIAYKTRGADGRVLELLPIPPPWVSMTRVPGRWELLYTITFPNGIGTIQCGPADVFHLRGPSYDGFVGADIIRFAREAVGLAMSGEEHQARIAEGSLQAPTYLTTPNSLTKEQKEAVETFLKNNNGGVRNAGRTALFQNGLEVKELGAVGQKAEILATRQFQIEEIARAFRVFPQMIGYTDKAMTHASAQDFFTAHVVHTMQPWAARWEQVITRDLLTVAEHKAGYKPKLMLQDLLRGDPASRGEFYKDLAQCGAITPNEIRVLEGMNPLEGLDTPLRPVNMTPETDVEADDEDAAAPARRPPNRPTPKPDDQNDEDNDEN